MPRLLSTAAIVVFAALTGLSDVHARRQRANAVTRADTTQPNGVQATTPTATDSTHAQSSWVPTAIEAAPDTAGTPEPSRKQRRKRKHDGQPAATPATQPAPEQAAAPKPAATQVAQPAFIAEPPLEVFVEIPADLRAVAAALDSADARKQVTAALLLRDIRARAKPAIPLLIRRLRSTTRVALTPADTSAQTTSADSLSPAQAAILALAAIGEPSVPYLNRAVNHDDPAIRRGACTALGLLKHGSSVQPLTAATRDRDEHVRIAAVEALGRLRDPRSIPVLKSLSVSDESAAVRLAAEEAHKELTDIRRLIDGLRDSTAYVRSNSEYILWLLTAKEFRRDAEQWQSWWRQQQGVPVDSAAVTPASETVQPKPGRKAPGRNPR